MDALLWSSAVFLFLNIMVGLIRVFVGPEREDRMLAAMLFGTTNVALLLVLAELFDNASIRDVALVFVAIAAVVVMAFGRSQRNTGRAVEDADGAA